MISPKQHMKTQGQSIIEFMVIIMVLILFMAASVPIVTSATAVYWLDERLYLRQIIKDDILVHRLLQENHKTDQVPVYFENKALKETSNILTKNIYFKTPGNLFPGDLIKKTTSTELTLDGWWKPVLFTNPQRKNIHLTRCLAMLDAKNIKEPKLSKMIRRLTLINIAPGLVKILKKAGFNTFHLNLNALPISKEEARH